MKNPIIQIDDIYCMQTELVQYSKISQSDQSHQQSKEKSQDIKNAEKQFSEIQYPFMINVFNKLGTDTNFLSFIKNTNTTTIASILLIMEAKCLFLRSWNKVRMCFLALLFKIIQEVLANVKEKKEKEIKDTKKKEIQLLLLTNYMIMQNIPKNPANTFLKLISNFAKVAECKIM